MKAYKLIFALSLVVLFMVSFSLPAFALTAQELGQYKEKTLIAPDFSLKDLEGKTHKLSDYKGKIVVLETGSSTWTPYLAQVAATQKLVKKWDEKFSGKPVKMFLIYVNEAHLEWKPKNTQERFERALYSQQLSKIVTGEDQVITTLVDEVIPDKPGSSKVGNNFGGRPNSVTVIDQEGKVIFFGAWYRFGEVDEVLTQLGKKQGWL